MAYLLRKKVRTGSVSPFSDLVYPELRSRATVSHKGCLSLDTNRLNDDPVITHERCIGNQVLSCDSHDRRELTQL
jgi:hypothetical protein